MNFARFAEPKRISGAGQLLKSGLVWVGLRYVELKGWEKLATRAASRIAGYFQQNLGCGILALSLVEC